MASSIPGLSFISAGTEKYIELKTFDPKTVAKIPESHVYGNCLHIDEFEKISKIATGKFGAFYKVKYKEDNLIYTLKKFTFPQDMLKNGLPVCMLREIMILRSMKHENIVNLYAQVAGKDLKNGNFLLLDYCVISLKDMIDRKAKIFEQSVIRYMMKELFQGLSFIHEHTVVHRNISTGNILFTESGTLKIGGFRAVRFYDKMGMSPTETEVRFRAPELLFKAKYDYPADIWSAGCVFAELLLKKPLFTGDSEIAVLKSIFSVIGTPTETVWPGFDVILKKGTSEAKEIIDPIPYSDLKNVLAEVPQVCSELLYGIFIYYPDARITASAILNSRFMHGGIIPACSPNQMKEIVEDAISKTVMSIEIDD